MIHAGALRTEFPWHSVHMCCPPTSMPLRSWWLRLRSSLLTSPRAAAHARTLIAILRSKMVECDRILSSASASPTGFAGSLRTCICREGSWRRVYLPRRAGRFAPASLSSLSRLDSDKDGEVCLSHERQNSGTMQAQKQRQVYDR